MRCRGSIPRSADGDPMKTRRTIRLGGTPGFFCLRFGLFLLLQFFLQCRLLGKNGVDLVVKVFDHNLGFKIDLVIILRAENDYKVNLKTEIMIEDLYDKVNAILAKQSALEKKLQEQEKSKS